MDAPNLLEIIKTWLNQSKWAKQYMLSNNCVACKCCKIIRMKVLNDRVRYGSYPRVYANNTDHPKHKINETLAADKDLFAKLEEALEKAEHDAK